MAIDSHDQLDGQVTGDPVRLLKDSGALLFGDFTLSSGKKSSYYFDSKKLTMEPAGARFVASQLVRHLDSEGIRYVGGVAYGAIPIVSQIVLQTGLRDERLIRAFYHRKESKEHGTGASAEGQFPPRRRTRRHRRRRRHHRSLAPPVSCPCHRKRVQRDSCPDLGRPR